MIKRKLSSCVKNAVRYNIPYVREAFTKSFTSHKVGHCINGVFCRYNGYEYKKYVGEYDVTTFAEHNNDKLIWDWHLTQALLESKTMTKEKVLEAFDSILNKEGKISMSHLTWLNNNVFENWEDWSKFLKERKL